MRELEFIPEAIDDYRSLLRWYREKSHKVASNFVSAIRETNGLLLSFPYLGSQVSPSIRRIDVKGFPIRLLYEVRPEKIRIIALWHNSRHPDGWKDRG